MTTLVYLHGFNSSPQSTKARQLAGYMAEHGMAELFHCPALPPSAREAMGIVEKLILRLGPNETFAFMGSSLGGFYATWLAEKYSAGAVSLNPAITPHLGLSDRLGPQENMYTGERYELTMAHVEQWAKLWCPVIDPSRYLLLVETGDEVLDYRKAVERYHGAEQIVVQGGDHALQSFPRHIPRLLKFLGFM